MAQFPHTQDGWSAGSAHTYLHVNWPCVDPFWTQVATAWLPGSFPSGIIKPALSHKCIHISPYLSSRSLPCWERNRVTWAQPLHCKCFCWPLKQTAWKHKDLRPSPRWLCWQPDKGLCWPGCLGEKREIILFLFNSCFFFYFASP